MGGAQAIAALAYGTATIAPGRRDRRARQRLRAGGQAPGRRDWSASTASQGPSRAGRGRRRATPTRALVALDLAAQAEHGAETLLVLAIAERCAARAGRGRGGAAVASARAVSGRAAGARAHPEPRGGRRRSRTRSRPSTSSWRSPTPRRSRALVRAAGCVFLGRNGGAAFGDYVAGSNHVLPTGGAARFAGPLGASTFLRRQALVSLPDGAARALAPHVGAVARAEGFPVHGESAEAEAQAAMRHDVQHHTTARRLGRAIHEGDAGPARAGARRLRPCRRSRPASGSSTTCSTCSRATRGSTSTVSATGDLETGAHHTTEDVGIVLGQALDQALGDRSGIARYGDAMVPMDEALGACAIDISGRPYCSFEATCPPTSIAGFETELTEEFFRAVANNAKLTVHLRALDGTNAHHMIEACFKAFARALREAVAMDPIGDRRALDEGSAVSRERRRPRIAILDYGMGNLRSVEKALERIGARPGRDRATTTLIRAADGVVLPGVGAFPKAMRNLRELELDVAARRSARGRRADARHLPRHAAAVRGLERERGRLGARAAAGPRRAPAAPGLKVPHIGWNAVRWSRRSRLTAELPGRVLLLLRALVRARRDRRATTCSGPPPTASRSPARSSASRSTASSSTRRSRAPHGLQLLENFARHLRRRRRRRPEAR